MYAVAFKTRVKDGIIEIPAEYRAQVPDHVRVILLAEHTPAGQADMIDRLLARPVVVRGFQPMSREEAHAR
jgi:hypothetical protein